MGPTYVVSLPLYLIVPWQTFPQGTTIPSEGFLVVLLDKDEFTGDYLHANFDLDNDGARLYLSNRSGHRQDSLKYPPLNSWASYGLVAKAGENATYQYLFPHSPGATNRPDRTYSAVVPAPEFGTCLSLAPLIPLRCPRRFLQLLILP